MRFIQFVLTIVKTVLTLVILSAYCSKIRATDTPFYIKKDLFDQTNTDSLGLVTAKGTETITVFAPVDTTDKFSNGVVMTGFRDYIYCQWQSSAKDEDAADTWVAYSRSLDGKNWSSPDTLAASIKDGFCSSGGWWVNGDTLVAYINVWPSNVSPRGGYACYTTSIDGLTWSPMKPLLMANGDTLKGIFEQDPHALPDGRIINAAHFQPGLIVSPVYTDDPSGVRGWICANFTNMAISGDISREIEPSWYLRSDDSLVMIFRDQFSTYKKLASISSDRGESWSKPVLTDMPDSRAKQSAGNIADSAVYMVSNPVNNKTRIPLAITLSKDGLFFNTAYILRKGGEGIQELRYEGNAKRLGYHYPKTMIWKDTLYVSYSTNKEDVEYTRVPLVSLVLDTSTIDTVSTSVTEIKSELFSQTYNIKINAGTNGVIGISLPDNFNQLGIVCIFNVYGQLIYRDQLTAIETILDMKSYPKGIYIIDVRAGLRRRSILFGNW